MVFRYDPPKKNQVLCFQSLPSVSSPYYKSTSSSVNQ